MVKQIVTMAFAALMAQCVWADMEAWTGTLSQDANNPTKVFTSVASNIAALKAGVENGTLFLGGKMGGGSITGSRAFSAVLLDTADTTDDALVYQFQLNDFNHNDDKHLKVSWVKFTNGEDGIYAVQTKKGYFNNKGPDYVGVYHPTTDQGWGSMSGDNYQVVELHVSDTAVATAVPSWVTTGTAKSFATLADAMSAADEATIIEGATVPDTQIEITRASNAFIYNGSVSVLMATKFTSGMGGSNKKNVTKKGSGTVTLTASNTDDTSCAMVIAEGTAIASAANAFGKGMLTVANGAVAQIVDNTTAYDVTLNGGTLKSDGVGDAHGKLVKSLTLGADSSFICTGTSGNKLIGIGQDGTATTLSLNTHTLTLTGKGTGRYDRVYLDNTSIQSAGTIHVTKGHLFLHCGSITAPEDTKIIIDANASIACDNKTLSVSELEYNGTVSVDSSDACMVTVTSKFSGTGSIPKLTLGNGAEVSGSATVTTEATAQGTVKLADGATLTVPTAFDADVVTTDVAHKHVVCNNNVYSLALDTVTISIPSVENTTVAVTVGGETVDASSGSIEATPGAEIVVTYSAADDYNMADVVFSFVAGEESTIDIDQVVPVAKVYVAKIVDGEDVYYYETLQAAIDDAYNGDTITVFADTTESVLSYKNITIHVNEGVIITGTVYYYTIFNGGTMTIEGDGTIRAGGDIPSGQLYIALYNSGTMYVKGCTIESGNHVIYENKAQKTEVSGGKFTKTPGKWLAGGYTTRKSADGLYYLVVALDYVAKIGTTNYETLQEALNDVKQGEMIELLCSTTEEVTFDKDFIVAIKNNTYNYGTIIGAKGLWQRWEGQYSNIVKYVVISKSMEDLIDHLTDNIAEYPGIHGRFYIYDDWTLYKNVTIPTVNDLSQSIFPVKDTFTLDLNGFTLDQAPVKNSHGGYSTIVADKGRKVTIKDSSEAKTGILCGIGWAVDVSDDPNTIVTLESGTITTHGAVNKNNTTMRGCVVRLHGGKFIMNGGAITLAHLEEGNQMFGVIITTLSSGYASAPTIEINGGYVQCATPEQLWDPDGTRNPNCLILEAKIDNEHKQEGEAKQMLPEITVSGGSFSLLPPTDYFAEGLAAVVDENGNFHVQTVVHESEDVTIAVSDDGKKLAPAVPAEGSVKIFASAEEGEKQVYVIDIAEQKTPAALYRIVTTDAEGTESTSNVGVIKVEEKTVEKTIAVAVPFTGATVENLLNTALLNAGDTVMAYVDGSYKVWELAADKTWQARAVTREGGTEMSPEASVTPLKRGQAVWVTTAGQVVTFGAYVDTEVEIELEDGHNLLGNTKLVEATPVAAETEQIQLIGEENVSRYNKTATGWESKIQTRTQLSNGKWVVTETTGTAAPKVKPGRGFWRIKPAAK